MLQTIKVVEATIVYDTTSLKIATITAPDALIDFTTKQRVHPVSFYYSEAGCTIVNNYAPNQTFLVRWQPGIVQMFLDYLAQPAYTYRIINRLACKETIQEMRKVLGNYVTYYSRKDAKLKANRNVLVLRLLTTLGNAEVYKRLAASLEDDAEESIQEVLSHYNHNPETAQLVKAVLALYFGQVQTDHLSDEILVSIPFKHVNTQNADAEVTEWAIEHKVIPKPEE